jgi:hypothetical protein
MADHRMAAAIAATPVIVSRCWKVASPFSRAQISASRSPTVFSSEAL